MGKRYGRNQKRRHREQIAALHETHVIDRALLDRTSMRAAELDSEMREWDEEIRRLCGEYSALRRVTPELKSRHPIREMPIVEPLGTRPFGGEMEISASMTMNVRERMRRFVFTLEHDDMRMQRLIRFMEADGRGGVAYAISDLALERGFGRREIAYLANEIATNMARHWNGQQAKERKKA